MWGSGTIVYSRYIFKTNYLIDYFTVGVNIYVKAGSRFMYLRVISTYKSLFMSHHAGITAIYH